MGLIWRWKKINDYAEGEPHVGKRKPGEDERKDVILAIALATHTLLSSITYETLEMEEKHANDTMTGPVDLEKIDKGILVCRMMSRVRRPWSCDDVL